MDLKILWILSFEVSDGHYDLDEIWYLVDFWHGKNDAIQNSIKICVGSLVYIIYPRAKSVDNTKRKFLNGYLHGRFFVASLELRAK